MSPQARIEKNEYYLHIARTVALRGNCLGRQVGAVAVRDDRIVATGYNGTPEGMINCVDGGCLRCRKRKKYPSGTHYDRCICVHAEANAIAMAARFGISLDGATLFSTCQPCFGCAKELVQAAVNQVIYIDSWEPPKAVRVDYQLLQVKLRAKQCTVPPTCVPSLLTPFP